MSDATKGFLIFIAIILAVGMCGGVGLTNLFTNRITYGKEIGMCQPTGILLDRDAKCAQQVNVPNSVANLNNGQSRVYNAQATAIAYNTDQVRRGYVASGVTIGVFLGFCIGPVVLLLALYALARKTAG